MKLFVRRHLDVIWRTLFSLGLMILAVSCSSRFPVAPIDSSTPIASTAPSKARPLPSATIISPTLAATATTGRALAAAPTPLPSKTAQVSPTNPPSPDPSAGIQRTITLADDRKTIVLENGQVFLLNLGASFDWRVDIADQTVLSRISSITVVKQAQGVYRANKPGATVLNAHGTIICQPLKVCAEVTREFQIQIVVQ